MGQNRHFIIFLIILVIFITGCSLKPVELTEFGSVDIQGINNNVITIKVTATVKNPNPRLSIKNSEIFVYLKDKELGKITQLDKIIVEGKTTKKYSTLLKVELTSLKGGVFSAMSLFKGGKQDLKISGKLRITAPFYWKTINIKDYPVKL